MKKTVALTLAALVLAIPATQAGAAKQAGPTAAQFRALQKQVTTLQKQVKTLQKQQKDTNGLALGLAGVLVCEDVVITDALQGTWNVVDQIAQATQAGKTYFGAQTPLAPDPFESLVTSITAQQVSLHAAFAIRSRFVRRFGTPAGRVWSFPARERVAATEEPELVALGFSRRKAEYVVGLARSDVDLDGLAALTDEEVKARLVELRGIGEWTAEWFLARHLARPRAWPVGDIGLRKAVAHFYGDADERAARPRFAPFENLSAHYLLSALYAGVGS